MTDPLLVQNPLPWTVRFTPDPSFVNDRCYELLDADGGTILCGYCPDLLHFIAETSRHFGILERLCQQVREAGLATGHADTPEELMTEVLEQVKELREALVAARQWLDEVSRKTYFDIPDELFERIDAILSKADEGE